MMHGAVTLLWSANTAHIYTGIYSHTAHCCIHPSQLQQKQQEWGTKWSVPAHQWAADSPPRCFSHLGWGFQPRRLKECVAKNTPTHRLSNKGKQHSGLCLHHPERSIQGPTPPPPRSLRPSDHITVMLMPAYRPLVKVIKPVHKQIQVCPEVAGCHIQQHHRPPRVLRTVTAYITKCIDDIRVTKTITVRASHKPWLTGEVYRLLKAQNAAFRAGDEEGLKTARANLSRCIREAKRQYSRRIAHRFSDSRDTRSLWQGIQTITDYKPPPQTCDSTIPLLNELNAFFARFEAQNITTAQKAPPPPGDQVMMLSPDSVRRSLSRINARKAPGPDNIPGRVLRDCAVELTDVFTDIFNISLSQAVVPTCFKATTIIPVPKKSSPSCFNDYRPVALTPIIMKCFERLVMHHIKSVLPPSLDPFQFAYRSNRSTDDTIATALHPALTHLGKKYLYVRMLFIDFSSAFNTIIPQQLTIGPGGAQHLSVQLAVGLPDWETSGSMSQH